MGDSGFWLVYFWEGAAAIPVMAFDTELEALRFAVDRNHKAAFVPFGVEVSEAVKKAEE